MNKLEYYSYIYIIKQTQTHMTVKFADYVGQKVHARFAVETNIDGCDVPVIYERVVLVLRHPETDEILLDCEDWDEFIYPFDETFELL